MTSGVFGRMYRKETRRSPLVPAIGKFGYWTVTREALTFLPLPNCLLSKKLYSIYHYFSFKGHDEQ